MFKKKQLVIHSMLSKETQIYGNLTFKGGMHIDGQITGNISCSKNNDTLIIGESGTVNGQIDVDNIIIEGTVIGNIVANKQLTIKHNGKIVGDVFYGKIQMEEGGKIQGKLVLIDENFSKVSPTVKVQESNKNTPSAQPVIPKKESSIAFVKTITELNKI